MHKSSGTANPPAFSREHLDEHQRLYPAEHLVKIKEIEARLHRTNTNCADPTYCQLRSLKKEHTYALNSVRLHGYFFGNLAGERVLPSPELKSMLERDFGSFEEWQKQFRALAMCSRGWVILGLDLGQGVLRNFFTDDHSEGVWAVLPLLVLDMYEHAWCNLFSTRADYVDSFIKCICWEAVNRRLKAAREIFKQVNTIF